MQCIRENDYVRNIRMFAIVRLIGPAMTDDAHAGGDATGGIAEWCGMGVSKRSVCRGHKFHTCDEKAGNAKVTATGGALRRLERSMRVKRDTGFLPVLLFVDFISIIQADTA